MSVGSKSILALNLEMAQLGKRRPDLGSLLGTLYGAVDSPGEWAGFLHHLCEATGADNAALLVHELGVGVVSAFSCHFDPEEIERYRTTYAALNPWLPGPNHPGEPAPVGAVVQAESFFPVEKMRETRFYREWGRANDVVHGVAIHLGLDQGRFSYLALGSGERTGPLSKKAIRLLEHLASHIRRAVELQRKMTGAATFAEALDKTAGAVFFVSRDCRVAGFTPSGQRLVEEGSILRWDSRGRLTAPEAGAAEHLREAVAAAGPRKRCGVVRLRESHLAVVNALERPEGQRIITVVRPAAVDLGVELLSTAFRLTAAESRLVRAILELGTLSAAARANGIARETAKTQLTSVFSRTGTRRQMDLVRLVCSIGLLTQSGAAET